MQIAVFNTTTREFRLFTELPAQTLVPAYLYAQGCTSREWRHIAGDNLTIADCDNLLPSDYYERT